MTMINFDELTGIEGEAASRSYQVTFLPEPDPRPRKYTVISVDDHVVESPTMFEGRMPKRFQDLAPRVVEEDDGSQKWHFDGKIIPNVGLNAVVGRPRSEMGVDPRRFDEIRPGTWIPNERLRDMDIDGVWASLNFPSMCAGFAGYRLSMASDPELGLAAIRAWNDWYQEEWVGEDPERFIPTQLAFLPDAGIAAEEIRRNTERGVTSVSFTEGPEKLGLPSIYDPYWDPFFQACEETETVITIHIGSSGRSLTTQDAAPPAASGLIVPMTALFTAIDWLLSRVTLRYPKLKVVLSEGGVGWVPMLLDRLDYITGEEYTPAAHAQWMEASGGLTMSEVVLRNFWFCSLDDPTTLRSDVARERIGADRLLLETDYPHTDTRWPDSQAQFARLLDGLPERDTRLIAWENASKLFRRPVPQRALDLTGW
jgi:predicted TIM-barrel fold metal-dependent hydrolase